jgi:hypothetical protein
MGTDIRSGPEDVRWRPQQIQANGTPVQMERARERKVGGNEAGHPFAPVAKVLPGPRVHGISELTALGRREHSGAPERRVAVQLRAGCSLWGCGYE